LASQVSESVVRKAYTYLNATLEEAIDHDFLMKNPCRKIEKLPKARNPCKRHLSPGEIEILDAIWATSIRHVNDAQEFSLAIELATAITRQRLENAQNRLNKGLYQVIDSSIEFFHGTAAREHGLTKTENRFQFQTQKLPMSSIIPIPSSFQNKKGKTALTI
jgi:hypothetical protein